MHEGMWEARAKDAALSQHDVNLFYVTTFRSPVWKFQIVRSKCIRDLGKNENQRRGAHIFDSKCRSSSKLLPFTKKRVKIQRFLDNARVLHALNVQDRKKGKARGNTC